jgi:hypothetical protein
MCVAADLWMESTLASSIGWLGEQVVARWDVGRVLWAVIAGVRAV